MPPFPLYRVRMRVRVRASVSRLKRVKPAEGRFDETRRKNPRNLLGETASTMSIRSTLGGAPNPAIAPLRRYFFGLMSMVLYERSYTAKYAPKMSDVNRKPLFTRGLRSSYAI